MSAVRIFFRLIPSGKCRHPSRLPQAPSMPARQLLGLVTRRCHIAAVIVGVGDVGCGPLIVEEGDVGKVRGAL